MLRPVMNLLTPLSNYFAFIPSITNSATCLLLSFIYLLLQPALFWWSVTSRTRHGRRSPLPNHWPWSRILSVQLHKHGPAPSKYKEWSTAQWSTPRKAARETNPHKASILWVALLAQGAMTESRTSSGNLAKWIWICTTSQMCHFNGVVEPSDSELRRKRWHEKLSGLGDIQHTNMLQCCYHRCWFSGCMSEE